MASTEPSSSSSSSSSSSFSSSTIKRSSSHHAFPSHTSDSAISSTTTRTHADPLSSKGGSGGGGGGGGGIKRSSSHSDVQDAERAALLLRKLSIARDVFPRKLDDDALKQAEVHHLEMPAHATRDSLLHSGSGFEDFRGLYNLALLILITSNLRMALENISKYGLLVNPLNWIAPFFTDPNGYPILMIWGMLLASISTQLGIEKLAARKTLSASVAFKLHAVNLGLCLVLPCIVLLAYHPYPIGSFLAIFETVIIFLKLISYVQVNTWFREHPIADADEHKGEVRYPSNLNLKDIFYFMAAPTLCYELNFPRTEKIRKRFLLRRVLELFFFLVLTVSLGQQWIMPTVNNTFKTESQSDLLYMAERTLKLAVPNFCIWLLLFYMFFHAWLNITGELLRFGDRQFYRDWWNATSIGYFWRNWNIPVHKWAVRHVYRPLVAQGYTRLQSQIIVFILSAFFHELVIGVPLALPRVWAFMAMVTQVPLALFTDRFLKGTQYGNVVMWASLFLGQPTAIMLYVKAYLQTHASP